MLTSFPPKKGSVMSGSKDRDSDRAVGKALGWCMSGVMAGVRGVSINLRTCPRHLL